MALDRSTPKWQPGSSSGIIKASIEQCARAHACLHLLRMY